MMTLVVAMTLVFCDDVGCCNDVFSFFISSPNRHREERSDPLVVVERLLRPSQ